MDSEVRNLRLTTGITVPCLVRGSAHAPPLLLLHAWGESRRSFDRLVPRLTDFRVYAPDLRGQGEADKPADGYSLAEQAGDAAAILDALNVQKAFVLGSSSGGYVAQQLAVGYPGRVAALVLVGSPLSLRARPVFADEVDRLTDPVDEDWVRNSLSWFPLLHAVPRRFIEDRVQDGVRMPAHAWKRILEGLCAASPPTESGTILAPTLILWGAHDGVLPRRHQEALAARIAGAELKVYPAVAHLVLWECPEQVAQDATAFLRGLPPMAQTTRPGAQCETPTERNVGTLESANEKVVKRLIGCINDRRVELMDELFHDDAVMHWPQSGELVRGAKNRRGIYNAFPQLPTITPRRLVSGGDLVVLEASLDYQGPTYETVFIFEFRDGKIATETAYWSEAFDAPAWRAQWVEKT